jgi:geranylgeranyl diphosphate synthase type I
MENCSPAQREKVVAALGNEQLSESQISEVQELITNSGALAEVEKLITDLTDQAILALRQSQVAGKIVEVLEEMAMIATQRSV